jgi:hypothetical protein
MAGVAVRLIIAAIVGLLFAAEPSFGQTQSDPLLVEVEILRDRYAASAPARPDEITTNAYVRLNLRVIRGISRPTNLRRFAVTLLMSALPRSRRLVLLLRDDRVTPPEVLAWTTINSHVCFPADVLERHDADGMLRDEYDNGDKRCGLI